MKKRIFNKQNPEFVVFFNSRNIRRKQIPDAMMAFRLFLDKLPKQQAKKCTMLLHTERASEHGTDLNAVVELLPENRSASVGIGEERLISHGKLLFPKYDIIVFIRLGQQVLEYCLQQAI